MARNGVCGGDRAASQKRGMNVKAGERAPILVVDDDPSIRAMLCDVLTHEGYRVAEARDGMEALAAVEREVPAAILLDVLMPMLDGSSLAQALRESGVDVPIVVVTASDAPVWGRRVGAAAVISKPFDLDELLDVVHRVGGGSRTSEIRWPVGAVS